jgi:large subunit ribosomal protein L15
MQRRLPKRGFKNLFRKAYAPVNVGALGARFGSGDTAEPEGMKAAGLMPRSAECVKILGDGEIAHKLTVKAHAFSKVAEKKIKAAGGVVEVIEDPRRKAPLVKGSGKKGKTKKSS